MFLPCICFILLPSSVHKIKLVVYTCSPFPLSYICMCERKSLFLTHFTPTSSASLPRHNLIFLFPRSVSCSSLWDSPSQTPQFKLDPCGFLFLCHFPSFSMFFSEVSTKTGKLEGGNISNVTNYQAKMKTLSSNDNKGQMYIKQIKQSIFSLVKLKRNSGYFLRK